MRCCDCENFSRNGTCDMMKEALIVLGYPSTVQRPCNVADASRCPDFQWSEEAMREEDEAAAYRRDKAAYNGVRPGVDFPASLVA